MKYILTVSVFFFPFLTHAAVSISEVQILPTDARFIELSNTGAADVDLTGWYIQRKTATGSSFSSLVTSTYFAGKHIKANGYFLISRSALSGADIVIDGLTLTEGNTLRMRNGNGEDVDQITWGSIPEGQSYQKTSSGEWIVASPTPGSGASQQPATDAPQQTGETAQTTQTGTSQSIGVPPVEPTIRAYAGQDRTVLAGADVLFEGKATGIKNEPMTPERFSWNFGDGATADGENVRHMFRYPGAYIVVLHAVSGKYAASDYAKITAIPADIAISAADPAGAYVEITNKIGTDIDMSLFRIRANGKDFTIPDHTVIAAKTAVRFHGAVTGLVFQKGDLISLLYPNGETLAAFSWDIGARAAPVATHTAEKTVAPVSEEIKKSNIPKEPIAVPSEGERATAVLADADGTMAGNPFAWWATLTLVAGLSAGSVVWVRRKRPGAKGNDEPSADDFTITDIS